MDGLLRDARFAFRALLRTPVLFAAAVLTLAAGTGLATGVAAVAYGVLLRPLPYADPDRLAFIALQYPSLGAREASIRLDEFEGWQSRLRTFEHVAAYGTSEFTLRGAGDPRSVHVTMVTDGFFDVLGVKAVEGSTDGIRRGQHRAAVRSGVSPGSAGGQPGDSRGSARGQSGVSPGTVRGQSGDSPGTGLLWQHVTIGAGDFEVAARMPETFTFPADRTELWLSADDVPGVTLFSAQDQRRFQMVGRLAPGVTLDQARDDVRRVVREMDASAPERSRRDADVVRVHDRLRERSRATVLPFLAGASLVLLIACANVSGLLVGRAVGRQREFAMRRALGGGVRDVLRASLAESFTVALFGWVLGLWVAHLVVMVFETSAAGAIQNLPAVRLDLPFVAASFLLAVVVALLSGGAPALRAVRANPNTALKQSSDRTGRGSRLFRGTLVAAQIAMMVVLLVAAGLLMRTVLRVVSEERGFDAEHALAVRLMLTQTVRFDATERAPFLNRLVSEVRGLPGVAAVGVGSDLPPNNTQLMMTVRVVRDNNDTTIPLSFAAATPGYLEAIGATLVKGRLFEERDRVQPLPVAVVTESAARVIFGDREPIGREWPVGVPGPDGKRVRPTVIGVVRDIKYGGLDRAAGAGMFALWERLAPGNAHLVVRTSADPEDLAPAVRRIIQAADPSLPLFPARTLEEVVSESLAERRLRLQLAAAFAALALALATVALWGAVAQSVLDRRHELAVRMALGATSGGAVRLMVRGGAVLTGTGVLAGALAGAAAARGLRHLLHGVSPADPITFGAGVAIAVVVSLVACYVPARRAASISPAELLRES